MPALYLFQKRTLLAGDDLQLPAFLTIGSRIVQVVCLTLPLSIWLTHDAGKDGGFLYLITDPSHDAICAHSHYFPLFTSMHLLATALFGILSVVLELRIWHWSCQGTPTIREPRSSKVQLLLERKFTYLAIFLMGTVFLYVTGVVFAQTYLACHQPDDGSTSDAWIGTHGWWILSMLLIFSQIAELVLITLFLMRLFLQQDDNGGGIFNPHQHRNRSKELWTDRCHSSCKCLSRSTCCLFGGQDLMQNHNPAVSTNNIYQQVAIALAEYLETRGTLDIVPSDLITGLLMLQKCQEQRKLKAQIQILRSSQQQRFTTLSVTDDAPGIQMETTNSSKSNKKSSTMTRRVRTGNTPEPASRTLTFAQQTSSNESLSGSGSSSSSLMGLETSQLVPFPENPLRRNIYRRVSGLDTLHYAPRARQVLDPNNQIDQDFLQDGARMAKFALAIYTWMLYVFVHPLSGFPKILCSSCKVCCSSKPSYRNRGSQNGSSSLLDEELPTTIGDNLCHWHKSALLLVAQLDHTDLVYAQFENRFSLMPYCILLDHETQCVIISIRGSLSLEDLVTDVMIDPESCEGLGEEFGFDARGQYCHAGVVACVKNIYHDLQRHRLLDSLAEDFPNYGLRIVGHSLGAASATLLGYILKGRYNDLKVYNFSPPGCAMTWELAVQCREWTTSFVLDSDIVPRLSVLAMEDLRDEVLQLVGNLKVPKHQVFESIFSTLTSGRCFGEQQASEPDEMELEQNLMDVNRKISDMLSDTEPADTLYHRQLQEFLSIQEELKRSRGDNRTLRLYPPGRMIHLLKTGEDSGCSHAMRKCVTCCMSNAGFRYTPIYISNDDLNEIVVCPTMGTDHFVDRMYDELSNVASQFERKYQDQSSNER